MNILDRIIAEFSPKSGMKRLAARQAFNVLAKRTAQGYDGAGVGRRSQNWRPRSTSADVEIALAGRRLRDRMRDLVRNTPHGREGVEVWVDYLVGNGVEVRANTGDNTRDEKLNALWAEWCAQCDADAPDGFGALQALSVRAMVEGGDCFIRMRRRRLSDGLAVPIQLQILEADHLDESKNIGRLSNGGRTVNGIEYDGKGARTAYWLFRDHPGDAGMHMMSLESTRVPANEIIHLYRRDRTQRRGVAWGAAIIQKMREHDDWTEAELLRKKIEACAVAFVTNADAGDEAITPTGLDDEDGAAGDGAVDSHGNPVEVFEPGLITYLHGNKDVRFNDPKATGGVEEWNRMQDKKIAEGWGVPYELLTGDLSQVNYSSIRTGLVKFKRRVTRYQKHLIIPRLCVPVWDWFVAYAYSMDLYDQPTAKATFTAPAFEEVDRTKEALADLMEIRSGTLSWPEAVARKGKNPLAHLQEISAMNELIDQYNVVLDSDPRKVSRAGLTQARPAGSELPGENGEGGGAAN